MYYYYDPFMVTLMRCTWMVFSFATYLFEYIDITGIFMRRDYLDIYLTCLQSNIIKFSPSFRGRFHLGTGGAGLCLGVPVLGRLDEGV